MIRFLAWDIKRAHAHESEWLQGGGALTEVEYTQVWLCADYKRGGGSPWFFMDKEAQFCSLFHSFRVD